MGAIHKRKAEAKVPAFAKFYKISALDSYETLKLWEKVGQEAKTDEVCLILTSSTKILIAGAVKNIYHFCPSNEIIMSYRL